MACNCNPVYGEICVFELGKNVEEIVPVEFNHFFLRPEDSKFRDFDDYDVNECVPDMPDYYLCVWWFADFSYERRRLDLNDYPIFKLANDPTCAVGRRDGYCSEIDYESSSDSPPALFGVNDRYNTYEDNTEFTSANWTTFTFAQMYEDDSFYPAQLAETLDFKLFQHINELRNNPTQFKTDHSEDFEFDFASALEFDQFSKDGTLNKFKWNNALSTAARHLVNDMGACGTTGDANSDTLPEILKKYYTHSYEDLDYFVLEHRPYGYKTELNEVDYNIIDEVDPGYEFLKFMLQEQCINTQFLHQNSKLEMGVACSCKSD